MIPIKSPHEKYEGFPRPGGDFVVARGKKRIEVKKLEFAETQV
jgi:hypothetical protein